MRRALIPALPLVLLMGLMIGPAAAGEHCDFEPDSDDAGSIKSAVDAADVGDTICLDAGVYEEPDAIIIQGDDLTLEGAGSDETTIVREGGSYGLQVRHADDVTLEGFTIRDADSGSFGYGLKLELSDDLVVGDVHAVDNARTGIDLNDVADSEFRGVEARGNGGAGIALRDSSEVTVADSETSGNAWGGLALWAVDDEELSDVEVTDSAFTGEAVGVFAQHGGTFEDIDLDGNAFEDNAAQVADETGVGALDLDSLLEANTFDRAVVVRGSGIKVPAILSSIQHGVDAADKGDTVDVSEGNYEEEVTVNVDDLSLVSDDATIKSDAGGGQAILTLAADGVTVDGFTVQATDAGATPNEFLVEGDAGIVSNNRVVRRQGAGDSTPSPGNPAVMISGADAIVAGNDITDGPIGGAGELGELIVEGNTLGGAVPDEGLWLVNAEGDELTIRDNDVSGLDTDTNEDDAPDVKVHNSPEDLNGVVDDDDSAAQAVVCDNIGVDSAEVGDGHADGCPPQVKDQCKDGGWEDFTDPDFRNQGQCIRYVNTGESG